VTDLEAAWNELHDAKPDGWFVGQPMYRSTAASEAVRVRRPGESGGWDRSREWTTVGGSELGLSNS
jgi:hypothetical protein